VPKPLGSSTISSLRTVKQIVVLLLGSSIGKYQGKNAAKPMQKPVKHKKIKLAVAIAMLLMLLNLPPTSRGDYNLQLDGDTFKVTWTINAYQNMSAYTHVAVYPPNLNSSLAGSDLSAFASALQGAVQQKVSSASISNLTVHVSSNSPDLSCYQACAPQWLNATAEFQVHEAIQTNSGVLRYDLSWKTARLDEDLSVANVSFNRIGEKYLVSALSPFVNFQSSHTDVMRVLINDEAAPKTTYQNQADAIVLFDMSQIQRPIEDWSISRNFVSQRETWMSPQTAGFNSSAVETITEFSEVTRLRYVSGAAVIAEMSTPMNTVARGDTLLVDLSGGFLEQIFLATILTSLGIFAVAVIIERRTTRSYGRPTKARRKGRRT